MRVLTLMLSLAAFLFATCVAASEAQTVAPPKAQEDIFHVLNMQASCKAALSHPKVLSSEVQPGAVIEGRKLVSGEVREVWQATPCGHRSPLRYLFRLTPDKDGEVHVFGFEPMR